MAGAGGAVTPIKLPIIIDSSSSLPEIDKVKEGIDGLRTAIDVLKNSNQESVIPGFVGAMDEQISITEDNINSLMHSRKQIDTAQTSYDRNIYQQNFIKMYNRAIRSVEDMFKGVKASQDLGEMLTGGVRDMFTETLRPAATDLRRTLTSTAQTLSKKSGNQVAETIIQAALGSNSLHNVLAKNNLSEANGITEQTMRKYFEAIYSYAVPKVNDARYLDWEKMSSSKPLTIAERLPSAFRGVFNHPSAPKQEIEKDSLPLTQAERAKMKDYLVATPYMLREAEQAGLARRENGDIYVNPRATRGHVNAFGGNVVDMFESGIKGGPSTGYADVRHLTPTETQHALSKSNLHTVSSEHAARFLESNFPWIQPERVISQRKEGFKPSANGWINAGKVTGDPRIDAMEFYEIGLEDIKDGKITIPKWDKDTPYEKRPFIRVNRSMMQNKLSAQEGATPFVHNGFNDNEIYIRMPNEELSNYETTEERRNEIKAQMRAAAEASLEGTPYVFNGFTGTHMVITRKNLVDQINKNDPYFLRNGIAENKFEGEDAYERFARANAYQKLLRTEGADVQEQYGTDLSDMSVVVGDLRKATGLDGQRLVSSKYFPQSFQHRDFAGKGTSQVVNLDNLWKLYPERVAQEDIPEEGIHKGDLVFPRGGFGDTDESPKKLVIPSGTGMLEDATLLKAKKRYAEMSQEEINDARTEEIREYSILAKTSGEGFNTPVSYISAQEASTLELTPEARQYFRAVGMKSLQELNDVDAVKRVLFSGDDPLSKMVQEDEGMLALQASRDRIHEYRRKVTSLMRGANIILPHNAAQYSMLQAWVPDIFNGLVGEENLTDEERKMSLKSLTKDSSVDDVVAYFGAKDADLLQMFRNPSTAGGNITARNAAVDEFFQSLATTLGIDESALYANPASEILQRMQTADFDGDTTFVQALRQNDTLRSIMLPVLAATAERYKRIKEESGYTDEEQEARALSRQKKAIDDEGRVYYFDNPSDRIDWYVGSKERDAKMGLSNSISLSARQYKLNGAVAKATRDVQDHYDAVSNLKFKENKDYEVTPEEWMIARGGNPFYQLHNWINKSMSTEYEEDETGEKKRYLKKDTFDYEAFNKRGIDKLNFESINDPNAMLAATTNYLANNLYPDAEENVAYNAMIDDVFAHMPEIDTSTDSGKFQAAMRDLRQRRAKGEWLVLDKATQARMDALSLRAYEEIQKEVQADGNIDARHEEDEIRKRYEAIGGGAYEHEKEWGFTAAYNKSQEFRDEMAQLAQEAATNHVFSTASWVPQVATTWEEQKRAAQKRYAEAQAAVEKAKKEEVKQEEVKQPEVKTENTVAQTAAPQAKTEEPQVTVTTAQTVTSYQPSDTLAQAIKEREAQNAAQQTAAAAQPAGVTTQRAAVHTGTFGPGSADKMATIQQAEQAAAEAKADLEKYTATATAAEEIGRIRNRMDDQLKSFRSSIIKKEHQIEGTSDAELYLGRNMAYAKSVQNEIDEVLNESNMEAQAIFNSGMSGKELQTALHAGRRQLSVSMYEDFFDWAALQAQNTVEGIDELLNKEINKPTEQKKNFEAQQNKLSELEKTHKVLANKRDKEGHLPLGKDYNDSTLTGNLTDAKEQEMLKDQREKALIANERAIKETKGKIGELQKYYTLINEASFEDTLNDLALKIDPSQQKNSPEVLSRSRLKMIEKQRETLQRHKNEGFYSQEVFDEHVARLDALEKLSSVEAIREEQNTGKSVQDAQSRLAIEKLRQDVTGQRASRSRSIRSNYDRLIAERDAYKAKHLHDADFDQVAFDDEFSNTMLMRRAEALTDYERGQEDRHYRISKLSTKQKLAGEGLSSQEQIDYTAEQLKAERDRMVETLRQRGNEKAAQMYANSYNDAFLEQRAAEEVDYTRTQQGLNLQMQQRQLDAQLSGRYMTVDEQKQQHIDQLMQARNSMAQEIKQLQGRTASENYLSAHTDADIQAVVEKQFADNAELRQIQLDNARAAADRQIEAQARQFDYSSEAFNRQRQRTRTTSTIGRNYAAYEDRIMQLQQANEQRVDQYEALKNREAELDKLISMAKPEDKEKYQQEKEINASKMQEYSREIKSTSGEIEKLTSGGAALGAAFDTAGQAIGRLTQRLGRQLFQKALSEAKKFVTEFNKSMTSIQMITLKTNEEMSKIGSGLIDKAKELKVSVSEITTSAEALYRQGLSDEEVNERLDVISKFSKVSGTKVDAATKLITVAMNTGLVSDPTTAADIVTALGDNAATNASEIEKGIEKAGAAAAADGTTFGQLAAMLTAITSTTQIGGNVAGRTLNTIFGRMNKIGTNELIVDENGNTVSGSSVAKLLSAQGIATYDESGNKRSSFDVLYELSQKWEDLSDAEQQQLANAIAGTRQYSNFASIMQGMAEGKIDEYMSLISDSSGITDKKYQIYTESLEASLTSLRTAFDALIADMTDSGALTGFIDGITNAINAVDKMVSSTGSLSGAIGALLPTLVAFGAIMMGIKSGSLTGIALGTVGAIVGTSLLSNAGAQKDAKETYTESLSNIKSKYESEQTTIGRAKELSSKENLTEDEATEYASLLNKVADLAGVDKTSSEFQSLTDSITKSGSAASQASANIKQYAQDIIDQADKESENDRLKRLKSISTEAANSAQETIDEANHQYGTESHASNTFLEAYYGTKTNGEYQIDPKTFQKNARRIGFGGLQAVYNSELTKGTAEFLNGVASSVGSVFGQDWGDDLTHTWYNDKQLIAEQLQAAYANSNDTSEYSTWGKAKWVEYLDNIVKTENADFDEAPFMQLQKYVNGLDEETRSEHVFGVAKNQLESLIKEVSPTLDADQSDALAEYALGLYKQYISEGYDLDAALNRAYLESTGLNQENVTTETVNAAIQNNLSKTAYGERKAKRAAELASLGLEDVGVNGYYYDKTTGEKITYDETKRRLTDSAWYDGVWYATEAEAEEARRKEYDYDVNKAINNIPTETVDYYTYNGKSYKTEDIDDLRAAIEPIARKAIESKYVPEQGYTNKNGEFFTQADYDLLMEEASSQVPEPGFKEYFDEATTAAAFQGMLTSLVEGKKDEEIIDAVVDWYSDAGRTFEEYKKEVPITDQQKFEYKQAKTAAQIGVLKEYGFTPATAYAEHGSDLYYSTIEEALEDRSDLDSEINEIIDNVLSSLQLETDNGWTFEGEFYSSFEEVKAAVVASVNALYESAAKQITADETASLSKGDVLSVKDYFLSGATTSAAAWASDTKNSYAILADQMLREVRDSGATDIQGLMDYINITSQQSQWSSLYSNSEFGHIMSQIQRDETGNITSAPVDIMDQIINFLYKNGRDYGARQLSTAERGQQALEAFTGITSEGNGWFISQEEKEQFIDNKYKEKIEEPYNQLVEEFEASIANASEIDKEYARKQFYAANIKTSKDDFAKEYGYDLLNAMSEDQAQYLKEAIGEPLYQKALENNLSPEQRNYINTLLRNRASGLTELTAADKLAGMNEIEEAIAKGTFKDYDKENVADKYMAGFTDWGWYSALLSAQGVDEKEFERLGGQEMLDRLSTAFAEFKKNAEINFEISGLQTLETAGKLLEGTASNVEKLRKGGKIAIEVTTSIVNDIYKNSQQRAQLYNGTISQQKQAGMSILDMDETQFSQDVSGNLKLAKQIDQEQLKIEAASREEELNKATGRNQKRIMQELLDAGYNVEEETAMRADQYGNLTEFKTGRYKVTPGKAGEVKYTPISEQIINSRTQLEENNLNGIYRKIANGEELTKEEADKIFNNDELYRDMRTNRASAKDIRDYASRMAQGQKGTFFENQGWRLARMLGPNYENEFDIDTARINYGVLMSGSDKEAYEQMFKEMEGGEQLMKVLSGEVTGEEAEQEALNSFYKMLYSDKFSGYRNAAEMAEQAAALQTGTAEDKQKVSSAYYSQMSSLMQAQNALSSGLNISSNRSAIASLLDMEDEQVETAMSTDEGKADLQKQITERTKKLYDQFATVINTMLPENLQLENVTDADSLMTELNEALEGADESLKGWILPWLELMQNIKDNASETDVASISGAMESANTRFKEGGNTERGYSWLANNWGTEYSENKVKNLEAGAAEAGVDWQTFMNENPLAAGYINMYQNGQLTDAQMNTIWQNGLSGTSNSPEINQAITNGLFGGQGGLFNGNEFAMPTDTSSAQNFIDKMKEIKNASDGTREVFAELSQQYPQFADMMNMDVSTPEGIAQMQEALKQVNEQMTSDKTANGNKYKKSFSDMPTILGKIKKGGKDASEGISMYTKNLKNYQDRMTAINKAQGKNGKALSSDTRDILAGMFDNIDADDIKQMSKDELSNLLDGAESSIQDEFNGSLQDIFDNIKATGEIDMSKIVDLNKTGEIDISDFIAACEGTAAEIYAQVLAMAKNYGTITLETDADGNVISINGVLTSSGDGKYNGGSGGGGGSGDSAAQDAIDDAEHVEKEYQHKINMIQTEQTHYQNSNDYSNWLKSINDEITAQENLQSAYQSNLESLKEQLAATTEGTDDWYDLRDAIMETEEKMNEISNTIDELNSKKITVLETKYNNENQARTHAATMLEKKASRYLSDKDYTNYYKTLRQSNTQTDKQIKANDEQIATYKKELAKEMKEGNIKKGDSNWYEYQKKIYELQEENADLETTKADNKRTINETKVSQLTDKYTEKMNKASHNIDIQSSNATLYKNNEQWKDYRSALQSQNKSYQSNIKNYEKAIAAMQKQIKGLDKNSDAWKNGRDQIQAWEKALAEAKVAMQENDKAIAQSKIDELSTKYERAAAAISHEIAMMQARETLYKNRGDFDNYAELRMQESEKMVSQNNLRKETLNSYINKLSTITDPTEYNNLLDTIRSLEEEIAKTTVELENWARALEAERIADIKKTLGHQDALDQHNLTMIQYLETRYQNAGEYTNQLTMMDAEAEARENRLNSLKAKRDTLSGERATRLTEGIAIKDSTSPTGYRDNNGNIVDAEGYLVKAVTSTVIGKGTHSRGSQVTSYERVDSEGRTEKEFNSRANGIYNMVLEQSLKDGLPQEEAEELAALIRNRSMGGEQFEAKKGSTVIQEFDDNWYTLEQDTQKTDEEIIKEENELLKLLKQREEIINKINQAIKTLEETIRSAYEKDEQHRKEMLAGWVSMENTILDVIKNRYKEEWDLIKQDLNKKKQALNEEKSLINERLNARKDALSEEDKYEQLAELRRQYALISADTTRTKDAKELKAQIEALEQEIAEDIATQEAEAKTMSIDQQISAIDDEISFGDQKLNELLSDSQLLRADALQKFGVDVNALLEGEMSDLVDWLSEWNTQFGKSTEQAQRQMIDSWEKTIRQMKGEIVAYNEEIIALMSGTEDEYVDKMIELMPNWNDKLEAEQEVLKYGWRQAYRNYQSAILDNATEIEWTEDQNDVTDVSESFDTLKLATTALEQSFEKVTWIFDDWYNKNSGLQKKTYEGVTPVSIQSKDAEKADMSRYDNDNDPSLKYSGKALDESNNNNNNNNNDNTDTTKTTTSEDGGGGGGTNGDNDGKKETTGDDEEDYGNIWRASWEGNDVIKQSHADHENKQTAIDNAKRMIAVYASDYSALHPSQSGYADNQKKAAIETISAKQVKLVPESGYANGGYVNYTGLAWVDGTKTRPESFLDATDTEYLRNMLDAFRYIRQMPYMTHIGSDMFGGGNSIGDVYVTINQAELKDDADFDVVAKEVGKRFVKQLSMSGFNTSNYAF